MAVPGRVEAASLLLRLDPPRWHVRHSAGVAEVAAYLAARAAGQGRRVDRALIEAAALLHDVDKVLPREQRTGPHGRASASWLTRLGYPELAPAVETHPVTRLVEPGFEPRAMTLEAAIVAYADKRVRQRLVSMRTRFDRWEHAHGERWAPDRTRVAWRRALAIERRVCDAAGLTPERVRRLRWVRDAMSAASSA
jgi:putative nucleotidyltransferase with HDIG domain